MKPGSRSAPKNNSRLLTPGLFGDDIAEIDVWRDSPQTGDCCSARATASLGDRRSAAGKVFRGPLRRGRAAVMARTGTYLVVMPIPQAPPSQLASQPFRNLR